MRKNRINTHARKTREQVVRYMVSGACATMCDAFVFYMLMTRVAIHYWIALLVSFTLGTMVNFAISNFFVFQRHGPLWSAFLKHYGATSVSFIVNAFLLALLIEGIGIQSMLAAQLGVATCTFLINFWLIKRFVFKN